MKYTIVISAEQADILRAALIDFDAPSHMSDEADVLFDMLEDLSDDAINDFTA